VCDGMCVWKDVCVMGCVCGEIRDGMCVRKDVCVVGCACGRMCV